MSKEKNKRERDLSNSLIEPTKELGYSNIYLDYLTGNHSASSFYHSTNIEELSSKINAINYKREELVEILIKQNKNFGSSQLTFDNIDKLKDKNAVTVFAGQQAVLFGGPLLVIFKALAVAKAAKLYEKKLGIPVIPIFWIAGDDHDFDEVNHTYILNRQSELHKLQYATPPQLELPIAELEFSDYTELHRVKDELKEALGNTDFTPELYDLIERAYSSEENFVSAFGKFMAKLTENTGLVFFSPGDKESKKMAIPFFKEIIERQDELHELVSTTNSAIKAKGYHIQVEKPDNATFLFYNLEGRKPVLRDGSCFKVGDRSFSKEELLGCLEKHPHRFSPDVMTRPVMQSFLFPVLSQKGGPAEIAYLAQINPIFQFFNLVPPFHKSRATATLFENRFEKLMKEYDISFQDLSGDIETVVNNVLAKSFPDDIEASSKKMREEIKLKFESFSKESLKFDPSLEKFAEQTMGKLDYQLNNFENKLFSSHKKKSKETRDKIYRLSNAIYPNRKFQERTININYYLSRYGFKLIDFIYDSLDSEESAHQIIHLSEFKN